MKRNLLLIPVMIGFLTILVMPAAADMSSTNFRIVATVISSGGGSISSANFQTPGTVGQPAPLMEPLDPPFSDNYDLYPGFWYTLAYYEVPKRSKSLPLILLLLNE